MNKLPPAGRWLDIEEVRLVSDLRIMHSKVDELLQAVHTLKQRNSEADIQTYADEKLLAEDIRRVDSIYLFYVALKEESESKRVRKMKK